MTTDRELSVIDEMLVALNKIDKPDDKQRAAEYVLRRVTSEMFANQMDISKRKYVGPLIATVARDQ